MRSIRNCVRLHRLSYLNLDVCYLFHRCPRDRFHCAWPVQVLRHQIDAPHFGRITESHQSFTQKRQQKFVASLHTKTSYLCVHIADFAPGIVLQTQGSGDTG